jgi:hypothetical protein
MVASISARGNAASASRYYSHLQRDDYYSRDGEPPGRWAGKGAERLSLDGPVTQTEFDAALHGIDPKTGERLAQPGRGREHSAGWDMTFSPPKSVSVLWALCDVPERQMIAHAHRSAVLAATSQLEAAAGWARRGRAGATREQTAGLLMAQFDHHTSRESDPQLHTHTFIFNLAPRRDGTWGAIISRELYKAQKQAGATYRREPGHPARAGEGHVPGGGDPAPGRAGLLQAAPSHRRGRSGPRLQHAEGNGAGDLAHAPSETRCKVRRAHQPLASRGQDAGVRAWPDRRSYPHHLQRTLSRGGFCWA